MSKQYEKQCLFCKEKILMSDKEGKWAAYNLNNGAHDCRKQETKQEPMTQPKQETAFNHNDVYTLEAVLAKLKLVGIDLDLKKLLEKESDYIK